MVDASTLNTLEYNPELCIGCEMCSIVCPHAVFAMNGRVAQLIRPESVHGVRGLSAQLSDRCHHSG
jgi:Fe-S-cluster-containing hydrogenase component 2